MTAGSQRARSGTSVATLAELQDRVGTVLGTSPWVVIEQADVDAFGRITRDEQWIHSDPARAADGPFGNTIAHGYLVLSYVSYVLGTTLEVRSVGVSVNYGLDRVRFVSPVPVGGRIRGHVRLEEMTPVRDGAQLTFAVEIELEGTSRPACVVRSIARLVEETRDRPGDHPSALSS